MDEITKDELLDAMARREGKERSRAVESHKYRDPAMHVRFEREGMDKYFRIKELLCIWARHYCDRSGGYPSQSPFVAERVDNKNRSTETYAEIPREVVELNDYIERLAPGFKAIISIEYMSRLPQKTKAAKLHIPRPIYSLRLGWIYEQLNHAMFGREVR